MSHQGIGTRRSKTLLLRLRKPANRKPREGIKNRFLEPFGRFATLIFSRRISIKHCCSPVVQGDVTRLTGKYQHAEEIA
jgi:hypothetical protein